MNKSILKPIAALILGTSLTACISTDDDDNSVNMPTANAGSDQIVDSGTVVTLSGTGSDSDGQIVSYNWSQLDGTTVQISGSDSATASIQTPVSDSSVSYTFRLTVRDNDGNTEYDDVVITVNGTIPSTNILGSWGAMDSENGVVITFLSNSTFVFSQHNATPDDSGQTGVEVGTYTWDSDNGAFNAVVSVDTNGEWGFSHPSPTLITVSGNSMDITYPGDEPRTIDKVSSSTGSVIGAWGGMDSESGVVITFLNNSTFVFSQHNSTPDDSGQTGIEVGTYSWDSANGAFNAIVNVDTNGEWGFSHPSPSLITVSGSSMDITYPGDEPRAIGLID